MLELEKHHKVFKNDNYCYVEMPNEDNKISHGEMSMKVPFIIYADLESLLAKWAFVIIILKNYQQPK